MLKLIFTLYNNYRDWLDVECQYFVRSGNSLWVVSTLSTAWSYRRFDREAYAYLFYPKINP